MPDIINGNVERIRTYFAVVREAWDTLGLPTILLAIILSLWIGWLPSPLSEARDILSRHATHDEEVLFYLKQTCIANMRLAQMPPDTCTWWPGKSSP